MEKLHVLHVIEQLALGGAERMAVDLANETARCGHRVTVCVTRLVDTLAAELRPEIHVIRLARRSNYELGPVLRLLRYVRRENVDLVHAHMRSSMALLLPFRALRIIPVPVVVHDHYGAIEVDTSVPRWFRIGHRWIDAYVGVSPSLGAWARTAGLPADRIEVIPNALDLTRLTSAGTADLPGELGLAAGTTLALIVATIRPDKGIEVALEAIAAVRHDRPIHVAIAGTLADPQYQAMLEARCRELGLDGKVTFLGARRDVPALLAACDLALSSSHTESGPLVLIEFLVAGRAFVATRVGDIGRRLAAAGLAGFVPPRDPAAMARAIEELLALPAAERATRGAAGRGFLGEFDLRAVFPRWLAVYARARGAA